MTPLPLPLVSPQGPASRRTVASDWGIKPFRKPATTPWKVPIPVHAMPRLLQGDFPQEMEDKWFVYADGPDGPDGSGAFVVHLHRSWTGFKVVELRGMVEAITTTGEEEKDGKVDGQVGKRVAYISEIVWELDPKVVLDTTEERAKSTARDVCEFVLGVKLVGEM
ncbi:hypothetical protein ASPCAL02673 [Aspergillus calidoustus]|uniref:Uncharacterized protein n=1 Tax=Aspergillus calidoustus TaxID=454130 RepID=A0A0U5GNC2_ASPCI|nr:hypothetical protein ASPCAL02673 [Aspergillus calidoustus]